MRLGRLIWGVLGILTASGVAQATTLACKVETVDQVGDSTAIQKYHPIAPTVGDLLTFDTSEQGKYLHWIVADAYYRVDVILPDAVDETMFVVNRETTEFTTFSYRIVSFGWLADDPKADATGGYDSVILRFYKMTGHCTVKQVKPVI